MSVPEMWRRWAIARTSAVRELIRDVTWHYNQWPITIIGRQHYLPISHFPKRLHCTANDNRTGDL